MEIAPEPKKVFGKLECLPTLACLHLIYCSSLIAFIPYLHSLPSMWAIVPKGEGEAYFLSRDRQGRSIYIAGGGRKYPRILEADLKVLDTMGD